jgi:hypothetical protein
METIQPGLSLFDVTALIDCGTIQSPHRNPFLVVQDWGSVYVLCVAVVLVHHEVTSLKCNQANGASSSAKQHKHCGCKKIRVLSWNQSQVGKGRQ